MGLRYSTPRIHPSIWAAALSASDSVGLKKRRSKPRPSCWRAHSAITNASCWSAVRAPWANDLLQRAGYTSAITDIPSGGNQPSNGQKKVFSPTSWRIVRSHGSPACVDFATVPRVAAVGRPVQLKIVEKYFPVVG